MKKIFIIFIFSFSISVCFSQAGEWVWIKGDSIPNQLGNYGVQGVPSPTNNPPSLYEPCEWTDLNGNFWLFGGYQGGHYGDLWKYNPLTNEWTWMKGSGIIGDLGNYGIIGVPSLFNKPPARSYGVTSWIDTLGNLWMFGGLAPGSHNDLWKYDISTNEWTWMKGPNTSGQSGIYGLQGVPNPANNPGARWECVASWRDNNNDLWLFGGLSGANNFNDLWKYNIVTNQWTWMKGSNLSNGIGIYGTLGVENSLNSPGARNAYSRWKDTNGNFWMLGGVTLPISLDFNDLWRFNPVTNNWTWMGGSDTSGTLGVYGTTCIGSSYNMPRSRFENRACWTDQYGNFWFLGGGQGGSGQQAWNDLWKYCVATNQWIWQSGDSASNPIGNWGTLGISNINNKPNGRFGAVSWADNNDHLYFFGGRSNTLYNNDLWKYTIDTTCGVCPTTTSIAENNSPTQLLIFPNPASNELTISYFQLQPNDEIIITDVLGKIILTKKITASTSEVKIQTSSFSNGIFFLQLKAKEATINKKVVVQH